MNYSAKLVDPIDASLSFANMPEVLTYTRVDQHTYRIAIVILATYQITNGSMSVNITDIPNFLNITIADIELWTVHPPTAQPAGHEVTTILATAPANGAQIILGDPSQYIYDTGIEYLGSGLTYKRAIIINISEYQIAGSPDANETLTTMITLGVPT
jgi:hypothetical protein